jgi:hypothetical protein
MSFDVIRYLGENFPELTLDAPLFYRWSIGLRFDLGGRACTPEQISEVLKRPTALFEAVFRPEDSCVIIAQEWPGDDNPPSEFAHLSPLFKFARNQSVGLEPPQGWVVIQEVDELEVGPHTLTWVEQPVRTFRCALILEGIANADHARRPAIGGRVYFINPLTHIIMHMYDDRGLDVIARNRDALDSLYHDFSAWILDYDRARIDQTFLR